MFLLYRTAANSFSFMVVVFQNACEILCEFCVVIFGFLFQNAGTARDSRREGSGCEARDRGPNPRRRRSPHRDVCLACRRVLISKKL